MKKFYSIAIPKPCHENWETMTPRDKGRFCNSCTKTVIDFTKMNTPEIQDFIHENKDSRICGHFKQTQLDSINIHIPARLLEQRQNFSKTFLLVLLIVMGTSLMNCTNKNGNKQKIDSVEIIDTLNNKEAIDATFGIPALKDTTKTNTTPKKTCKTKPKEATLIDIVTDGELVLGDIEIIEEPPIRIDSLNIPEPEEIMGIVDFQEEKNPIIGFITVESPPEFKNTPKKLSLKEKRALFSKKISAHIKENFKIPQNNLDLTGKQKINVQFEIDSLGSIQNIKTRAPHPNFEKEAKRSIKLLPQFIPAKQNNKPVSIVYNLPIIFQIED